MADNYDQSRSDNIFYMRQLHARACTALKIDPDRSSWFDIVDGLERLADPDKKVLGVTSIGAPIYECLPDRFYSAAAIHCAECGECIRGMGGPLRGAKCLKCRL